MHLHLHPRLHLLRKLLRDAWRNRGQGAALALVLFLGISSFVAAVGSYRDLDASYSAVRRSLALADLHIRLTGGSEADVRRVAGLPGVAAAEGRMVSGMPARVQSRARTSLKGEARIEARVVSLPGTQVQPRFDRLHFMQGGPPGPGEVVAEQHFAAYHKLRPGDTLVLDLPGVRSRTLRVSGVAISAEYLWVTRDQDPMPTPDQFGVFWMPRHDLAGAARKVGAWIMFAPAGKLMLAADMLPAAREDAVGQILVGLAPGADAAAVAARIRLALGRDRVLEAVAADDIPSIRMLQMDLDAFRGMAAFFPALFLAAAVFMAAAAQARFVEAQRAVIGTLLALGMPRRRVMAHYLAQALAPSTVGAGLGALGGLVGSAAMTRLYAAELGLPLVEVRQHWDVAAIGVAAGLAAALLAGWFPAWRAASMPPAAVMRRAPLGLAGGLMVVRHLAARLPPAPAMAIRGLFRRPVRNLLTACGIASAVVLLIATGAVFDSMESAIERQFDQSMRYDIRADLMVFRDAASLAAEVGRHENVGQVQVGLTLPVEIGWASTRSLAIVEAARGEPRLTRILDASGRDLVPARGGIILAKPLETALGLPSPEPALITGGRPVELRRLPGNTRVRYWVSGAGEALSGGYATLRYEDAEHDFGLAGKANTVMVRCREGKPGEGRDCSGVRTLIESLPQVIRLTDVSALRALLDSYMALGYALLGLMVGFGASLAGAILYNTVTMSILERSRDVATLRALGMPMRRIAGLFTLEHGILAALGLLAGIPAGIWLSGRVLALYDSDLFSLPFAIYPRTLIVATAGVLLVLIVGQLPALRTVARQNVAEAVREREG